MANDIPSTDVAKRFARNLVEQREKKGLDPGELAKHASVPLSHLTSLEAGVEQPEMEMLIKLAAKLRVSIDDLAAGLTWDPVDGFRVADSS